jgi:hypothetical protein
MNDFDFIAGRWRVHNRRQDKWLAGSTTFEEFEGFAQGAVYFDGRATFDHVEFPSRGTSGLTLRLYDPETELWSIYWAGGQAGKLDPPVVGRFHDGVGTFIGDDTFEGRPIKVRFTWSEITSGSARWQQELSGDGGRTWELNWVMELTRVAG